MFKINFLIIYIYFKYQLFMILNFNYPIYKIYILIKFYYGFKIKNYFNF